MSLPKFDETRFGSVTIDGKLYSHDVYVYFDGRVEPRTSSHVVDSAEMERVLRMNPEVVIVGTGQAGCVVVEREAQGAARRKGIELIQAPTPEAIQKFNELAEGGKRVCSIIHVTC